MSDTKTTGGIGFFGILTILFIGLKLGGVITWSWIWVLSPLWLPSAIFLSVVVLFFLMFLISKIK